MRRSAAAGPSSVQRLEMENEEEQDVIHDKPNINKTGFRAKKSAGGILEGFKEHVALGKRAWRVLSPFLGKENPKKKKIVLMVCLLIAESVLLVYFSYAEKKFSTALNSRDRDGFWYGVWQYMAILCVAAPLFSFSNYVQGSLALDGRSRLTHWFSERYFRNENFFRLKCMQGFGLREMTFTGEDLEERLREDTGGEDQAGSLDNPASLVDNPDQRIGQDVSTFSTGCVNIMVTFIGKTINILGFMGVLIHISSSLTCFVILYSAFGTWITVRLFSARLKHLHFEGVKKEANFRFSLVRVREHAEEIAFFRGGHRELEQARGLYSETQCILDEQLKVTAFLNVCQYGMSWLTSLLPYVVVAGRYFSGAEEYGTVTQTIMAFRVIQSGLSFIVKEMGNLAALAAETDRLHYLMVALMQLDEITAPLPNIQDDTSIVHQTVTEHSMALSVKKLTLFTPDLQSRVCLNLSFDLLRTQSLLIVGPSGCGKSSLLRAIAGLWHAGSGEISTMPSNRIMFLPQKPYMPLGSLRQLILYPMRDDTNLKDAAIRLALSACNLSHIAARHGGLGAVRDWTDELSQGEQQRVSFARLLVFQPELAIFDESTSALDSTNESALYESVRGSCSTFVSVGHRSSLFKYHSHVLECSQQGSWAMIEMNHFLAAKNRT